MLSVGGGGTPEAVVGVPAMEVDDRADEVDDDEPLVVAGPN